MLPGILHELLNQHDVIVEGLYGLSSRRLQLLEEVRVCPCDTHPLNRRTQLFRIR